jgi:hypothetical protein
MATFVDGVAQWTRSNVMLASDAGIDLEWFRTVAFTPEQAAEFRARMGPIKRALHAAEIASNQTYKATLDQPVANIEARETVRQGARATALATLANPRLAYRLAHVGAVFDVYEGAEALENAQLLAVNESPTLTSRVCAKILSVFV